MGRQGAAAEPEHGAVALEALALSCAGPSPPCLCCPGPRPPGGGVGAADEAWGLQTCPVSRAIHAQVTVNSWQSRVPCVPVWGRRNGADPKARGSVVVPSYPIAPSCTPPGACRVIHPAGGMARRAAGRQDRDRGGEPVERAVHY